MHTIANAEKFVYIENQFFVSNPLAEAEVKNLSHSEAGVLAVIQNRVAKVIVDRILKAAKAGERFKIYVVIPVMPGEMIKDPTQPDSYNCRAIINMNLTSISRGPHSIYGRLEKELPAGCKPDDFIAFFSLRTAGMMPDGTMHQEQIYIHSKFCVADDKILIKGSANMNDRSQVGSRDAEIAVCVEDSEKVQMVVDGKPYTATKFAHDARAGIWAEHFEKDYPELQDPCSDTCMKFWQDTAKWNSQQFRKHFSAWPDNEDRTYAKVREAMTKMASCSPKESDVQLKGRLIEHPIYFLADENILRPASTGSKFAPQVLFA